MQCPICKKSVPQRDASGQPNPSLPFCSQRCRTIDLGRWLGEKYQIPVNKSPSEEDVPPVFPHSGGLPEADLPGLPDREE